MSNKTENLKEKYKGLLPIKNRDYKDAKKYYEKYLKLFDGIINCKDEESLKLWKKVICKNNPWEKALKSSNEFRSIADSDFKILKPLIEEEIDQFKDNIFSKKIRDALNEELNIIYSRFGGEGGFNNEIKESIAKPFFKKIFSDFEQAFDGNFENPRVVILGINPKLSDIEHKRFNLQRVYKKPFNSRRNTLFSNNRGNDKYYFVDNGFFFSKNDNNVSDNIIKDIFFHKVNNSKIDTPYCLWEFFPYATNSEKEWYDEIKVSNKIKKYLDFKKVLPSQIWLLCILTYSMKKAIFLGREMYLFLTKNNQSFRNNFFKNYLELLKLQDQTNIIILTKIDNQNRNFHYYNIKNYFDDGEEISFESVEEFFKVIWEVPLFKLKRKRKRAIYRKLIRKRIVKSRKV